MNRTKRISAAYVYTAESVDPLRNSYVEYDSVDGRILEIGKCDDSESVENIAIVPGFVNAHCHSELSHLHGKFYKGSGMAGFIDQINALRDWAGNDVKSALVQKWMDKMWADGVAALADISNDDSSFKVKSTHNIYTRTFLEVFGTEPEQCPEVMSSVTVLNENANANGIDAAPTPHSCYTMSPELLAASAAAGLKSGFLSYHSQESQEEEDLIRSGSGPMYENRKRAGMSTPPVAGTSSLKYFIDILEKNSLIPTSAHILLVHNVCISQEDIDLLKSKLKNVYFALCPLSNLFIHSVLPPVELMRANGLNITIGTDSLSSNDDLSMIAEIACLKKNFPTIPMGEIFQWATIFGARFLCKESQLGSISIGKRPGLVLIDGIDEYGNVTEISKSRRII